MDENELVRSIGGREFQSLGNLLIQKQLAIMGVHMVKFVGNYTLYISYNALTFSDIAITTFYQRKSILLQPHQMSHLLSYLPKQFYNQINGTMRVMLQY